MQLISFILAFLLSGGAALANSVAGPHLNQAGVGSGNFRGENDTTNHNLSKRRTDFKLLIPLPQVRDDLQLVPQLHIAEVSRRYNNSNLPQPLPTHSKMADVGLISAWSNAERDMQVVLIMARYAHMSAKHDTPAMAEFIGAVTLTEEKVPGVLQGSELMAALRFRRFPYADRWLPLLGYKQRLGNWFYDVLMPSHGMLAYDLDHGKNYLLASVVLDGRQEEFSSGGQSHWAEGYATNLSVAWMRQLANILYMRLDVGAQTEFLEIYTAKGRKIETYNFAFAPLVQFSLLTLVPDGRSTN